MNCLADEALRALIDREGTEQERENASRHLKDCAECRLRLERLSRESTEAGNILSSLEPGKTLDPSQAFERLQERLATDADEPSRRGVLGGWFSTHPLPAWGSLATAALIAVLMLFAPARSWTQRILAMLRVQKVTVVPVDLNFPRNSDTQALVRRMISKDVTVTLSAGKPHFVADASKASQVAGFKVRTLTAMNETPKIGVLGEQSYVMKLDRNRLQAVLEALGRQDLKVPESVNDKMIAVHVSKSVFLRYGNCPDRHSRAESESGARSAPTEDAGCVMFAEVPSPIVSVPPELDVSQLFQIALQAAGMTPEQAQQFCSTVDWKSTLVVPIPRQASTFRKEVVDGVEGNLILGKARQGHPAVYTLIWVKNGIIYSIHGAGGANQALALAGSLS